MRLLQPFMLRKGSKEAGQKWAEVARNLNNHPEFQLPTERYQKSVREQFNKLMQEFKNKLLKEENAPGMNPGPLSEADQILEEIKEVMDSSNASCSTTEKAESDRHKALKIRNKAMTTWGKEAEHEDEETDDPKPRRKRMRRNGTDPLEFLQAKREADLEIRKEEVELRREQLNLERQRMELMQQQQPRSSLLAREKTLVNSGHMA